MREADEILSNGFATMGPILSGVMAVHRSTIDHLMGRVPSNMSPEAGGYFYEEPGIFLNFVMTALAPCLECCGFFVGYWGFPGAMRLDWS